MNHDVIGKTFNNGKLTVIGLSSNRAKNGARYLRCKCNVCSLDIELFGDGIFEAQKGNVLRGKIPCGCSSKYGWNEHQNEIRLKRISNGRYTFIYDALNKAVNEVRCVCSRCRHSWTATLARLLRGSGCIKCAVSNQLNENSDNLIESECIASGSKFNGYIGGKYNGAYTRLNVDCACGRSWKPTYNEFVNKHRSICTHCKNPEYGFSFNKQGTLYIVFWENDYSCFVKYGISNRFKQRIKDQQKSNFVPTIIFSVEFDGKTAKELESELDVVRKKLYGNKGFIPKELFPDGYTETVSYVDLNLITDLIYDLTLCRIS